MSERTFDLLEALSLSCAVQRTKGKYVKLQISFDDAVDEYTNKDVLMFYLVPGCRPDGYVPNLKVLQVDRDQAAEIIKFYRRLMFGVLAENINNYLVSISRILSNSECTIKDLGIISSIPSSYIRDYSRLTKDKIIKESSGEVFGSIGDAVDLHCYIVDVRRVQSIDCIAHTAVDSQGNLIEFLSKKQIGFENDCVHIRARVKKHSVYYRTEKPVTQLNYVKIVDNTLC